MIRAIRFELKKYVLTKQTLSAVFILTLAGAVLLVTFNLIPIFETQRKDRQAFYDNIGDSFSEEDKQGFIKEKEKLERELGISDTNIFPDEEKMWQEGKYTSSKWYDLIYLRKIMNCIEYVEKRNMITENALRDSNIFTSDYYSEDNHVLADMEALSMTVRDMGFGWFSCIAVIIIFSSSFSVEYGNNIYSVLCVTKKGYWSLCIGKMLLAVLVSVAVNIYFWGIYLIGENLIRGGISLNDWKKPLFLAGDFMMCASGQTVAGMLAVQVAASVLVSVLVSVLTMFLSRTVKKGLYSMMTALVFFVVMLLPNILDMAFENIGFLVKHPELFPIPEPEFYKLMEMEKTLNPFSLISFRYYAMQPQYIQISGSYYPLYCIPVIIAIVLTGIFCCVLLCGKKRGL